MPVVSLSSGDGRDQIASNSLLFGGHVSTPVAGPRDLVGLSIEAGLRPYFLPWPSPEALAPLPRTQISAFPRAH